ncbi:MAG: twin-arginine translocation signal domain-containing protein, partial [Myxococcales bacterium]
MAPTRRTLLKTAGVAAVAGKLLKPGKAQAQGAQTGQGGASLRGLTYCNLRSGLGVKLGDRILDVARAA